MEVVQVGPGLWVWSAPHPDWGGATDWSEDVNCVAEFFMGADGCLRVEEALGRFEAAFARG
jgi:hypothetical protein